MPAAPEPSQQSAAPVAAPAEGPGPQSEFHAPQVTEPQAPEPEVAEPPLPPEPVSAAPVYSDPIPDTYGYEEQSSFAHEPPFRPRRNPAKLWTAAAVLFALVAIAGIGATLLYGTPSWLPFAKETFAPDPPGLVLDFPPNRQDRRTLPNGTEFYGTSGTITNVGTSRRSVPAVLVVLYDAKERVVYRWKVIPPKRELAPGESMTINEALTVVPKSAKYAVTGWSPD